MPACGCWASVAHRAAAQRIAYVYKAQKEKTKVRGKTSKVSCPLGVWLSEALPGSPSR